MNLRRRLESLEKRHSVARKQDVVRVMISSGGDPDWERSTCRRRLIPGGALMEFVDLEGGGEDLDRDELERFVARFPIELASPMSSGVVR